MFVFTLTDSIISPNCNFDGNNIIFVADGGSWRNNIEEVPQFLKNEGIEYKGNRVHSLDIDWDAVFEDYESFLNLLSTNVLSHPFNPIPYVHLYKILLFTTLLVSFFKSIPVTIFIKLLLFIVFNLPS